jgi:hypothetical protein
MPEGGRQGSITRKGRREGVEDAIKGGARDGIPEHVVTLANRFSGFVGIESLSTVG